MSHDLSHDLSHDAPAGADAPATGGCSCGHADEGIPELDARTIPHAVRHAAIIGAFEGVPAGGSLILTAPHNPVPLLEQLSERVGGALQVRYLEQGPDAWRLQLTRV